MRNRLMVRLVALVACVLSPLAHAGPAMDVVDTDLKPLIAQAVRNPDAFAVPIERQVTTATAGEWGVEHGMATWRYAVRIPGAVSTSFHAGTVQLPVDAVLTVTAADQVYVYTAPQLVAGQLWSHVAPGDELHLSLTLPLEGRKETVFVIDELQAGYRGLGGAPSHPYYRTLVEQGAAATATDCVQNYECSKTSANDGPGRATMAVVVANAEECTGTLLNDVPGDYANYVLTARHCEDPSGNGRENPDASRLTFYWNATTPCGQTLASIYSAATSTTAGATTLVEQMDAWLVKLNSKPPSGVYYAGWDAIGSAVVGGYGIHHAEQNAKQYVAWYGQADYQTATFNGMTGGQQFQSETAFWGVNPQLGREGRGASGSALFDAGNHVVGSLTGGSSACPTSPPTPPSAQGISAYYTALKVTYNSTVDRSSTFPTATMAQYLDPGHTGVLVNDGREGPMPPAPPSVAISASPTTITLGGSATLTWSSAGADACVASGAWSGAQATSGSAKETPGAAGTVTYTLTCTNGGGSVARSASVVVNQSSGGAGGGGGGGRGGGGAFGFAELAGLVAAAALGGRVRGRSRLGTRPIGTEPKS